MISTLARLNLQSSAESLSRETLQALGVVDKYVLFFSASGHEGTAVVGLAYLQSDTVKFSPVGSSSMSDPTNGWISHGCRNHLPDGNSTDKAILTPGDAEDFLKNLRLTYRNEYFWASQVRSLSQ